MTKASPTTYELQQNPDGVWRAVPVEGGGGEVDHVAGWDTVAELLRHGELRWCTPSDLSRFRSQYGEPPASLDARALHVAAG